MDFAVVFGEFFLLQQAQSDERARQQRRAQAEVAQAAFGRVDQVDASELRGGAVVISDSSFDRFDAATQSANGVAE